MSENYAWVVLVMEAGNGRGNSYACGAIAVAESLRQVSSVYPAWCMIAGEISAETESALALHFEKVIHVPIIEHATIPMHSRKQAEIYGSWLHRSFTKWNVLNPELFPLDKAILLDADSLFRENSDCLFKLQAPAMTFSSPWVRPYAPRTGGLNPYGQLCHGQIVKHSDIRAGLERGIVGLACMVLVQPNTEIYEKMVDILCATKFYGHRGCIAGFDEQLIADTILQCNLQVSHIHQRYNWIVGKYNWLPSEPAKVWQYYNDKPWADSPTESKWDDVRDWWKVAELALDRTPEIREWFLITGAEKNK